MNKGTARLAIAIAMVGDKPPTEFRLFVAGWNETEGGRFLFDAEAASATMSAYKTWGVDLAIDLEHQMLAEGIAPDPTAKDARGWCKLELRSDGSLWAVDVTWTPDGFARLTEKRQRYVSPAFGFDKETRRVSQIVNVAITAMPATHNTPALVAASRKATLKGIAMASTEGLTPKLVSAALEAVASKDAKGGLGVLQQILAALLGGSEEAPPSSSSPPDSSVGAPPDPAATASADPKKDTMAAAARVAIALTGKTDPGEAMAELARRSTVAVDLESREATLAVDRATLESGERRKLVGELVKLGVELPATAWGDDKGTVPCARLAAEPIADLRARVALLAANAPSKRSTPTPPAGGGTNTHNLTPAQLAICAELKCDPAVFATLQAKRDSVSTGGT